MCFREGVLDLLQKDNSLNPVTPSQNRLWGYYKIVLRDAVGNEVEVGTYGTDGATCYYCLRVWNTRPLQAAVPVVAV